MGGSGRREARDLAAEKRAAFARAIFPLLEKMHPAARCDLDFASPLELLVAAILAAQCTDKRVNAMTPALFERFPTARDLAEVDPETLEKLVKPTGFFRVKAKSIRTCCREIAERHAGEVPRSMEDLVALGGVGRKTANLVRAHAFGLPGLVVDTHFKRVAARLGLTTQTDPDKIEEAIAGIVPEKRWTRFSDLITFHGRYVCKAAKPRCPGCLLNRVCPSASQFYPGADLLAARGRRSRPPGRPSRPPARKAR